MDESNIPLKTQTEISLSVEDLLVKINEKRSKNDHKGVVEIINKYIDSTKVDSSSTGTHNIFTELLEVSNGNKIIQDCLDTYVSKYPSEQTDENDDRYAIQIDFSNIIEKKELDKPCSPFTTCNSDEVYNQTVFIKHLLDHYKQNPDSEAACMDLLNHPVIAIFLSLKWMKSRRYFYIQSMTFFLFLTWYLIFIGYWFTKPCRRVEQENCNDTYSEKYQVAMFRGENKGIVTIEILLVIFTVLLALSEMFQIYSLRRQYWTDLENWVELPILISAIIAMWRKEEILLHHDDSAQFVRGITALGVSLGGLEAIFLIGRYPLTSGIFNTMYYTVVKKVLKYVFAMLILIVGFAFAFMIVHYGHNYGTSFRSPFKSIINTFTMTLEEYNFGTMYKEFNDDSFYERIFALILLVMLLFFGSICMVNLLVAVIISDTNNLKSNATTQSLISMAKLSIIVEGILFNFLLKKMMVKTKFIFVFMRCAVMQDVG